MSIAEQRREFMENRELQGSGFTHAYTDALDVWIADIATEIGIPEGAALVAIGGYGRREMSPFSDVDIALVHRNGINVTSFAERIWYPMWDAGLKVGQQVGTPKQLLKLAANDLDTATALLAARHLVGDESLSLALAIDASRQWRDGGVRNALWLGERMRAMHDEFGEVAFLLSPDLKHGRGALRDVHGLDWVLASGAAEERVDVERLRPDVETILRARVALHRVAKRSGDRLALEYQDDVADELNYSDADALMADIAAAGRSIDWTSSASWFWVERSAQKRRRASDVIDAGDGIRIDGSLLSVDTNVAPSHPAMVLRIACAAAQHHAFIERSTLEWMQGLGDLEQPWDQESRDLFVKLLSFGRPMIPVIEALDRVGLMSRLMPEWEPSRSRPQRNAYHRFTVDRHLLEAAAEASLRVDRVQRPDLLVVGALLHDIGKGYPGDHTDVGIELIDVIGPRMGFDSSDVRCLADMCRYHLLLPDVATRRDLDDDQTIQSVADQVGTIQLLELLGALTESDSIATGPSAWNSSKAELVNVLVERTAHVLDGGRVSEVVGTRFPDAHARSLMQAGSYAAVVRENVVTVVQADGVGTFSRVAGVLTLNGLDIVGAAAHTEKGMALSEFTFRKTEIDRSRLEHQLAAGTAGTLAIEARIDERRSLYARSLKRLSAKPIAPSVRFDDEASEQFTVIEVAGKDQIGLLYRVARALADVSVVISSARIQTIADSVIDTFYVSHDGRKITDPDHRSEIEWAVLHALERQ